MKKFLLIVVVTALCLPSAAGASVILARPANLLGVTASWSFDTNTVSGSSVTDTSGNGKTMTLTGTSAASGKSGQARLYNGSSDYGVSNLGTQPTSISVSLWFYANSTATQSLVDFQDSASPVSGYHMTVIGIKNNALYASYWNINNITSSALSTGRWYHAVLTYDNTTHVQNLYLNGALQSSNTGTWSGPGTLYFYLAQRQQSCSFNDSCSDNAAFFNGSIDEVKVFNRALTAADVRALYGGTSYVGRASSGTAASSPLSQGLVGYWPLDGATTNWTANTTRDISGQGNTGALVSMSTSTSPIPGKIGQALNFNGSTSYVSVSDAPALDGATGSISFWYKIPTASSGNGYFLVGKADPTSSFNGYTIFSYNGQIGVQIKNGIGTLGMDDSAVRVGASWHHVVLAYSAGGSSALYVDGALARTGATPPFTMTTQPLRFGKSLDTYWQALAGSLDDVRAYSRALSASEVAQLYQAGRTNVAHSPGPATNAGSINAGLSAYWTMDGSSINWRTNTMADQSGQGNPASLIKVSTTSAPTTGKLGQALSMSGSGQYISASAAPSATSYTVSAWIRYQGAVPISAIKVALSYGSGSAASTLWMGYSADGSLAISNSNVDIKSPSISSSNAWQHLVAVVSGGTLYAYMNGVLVGTASMGSRAANTLLMGDYIGYIGTFSFPGAIDDVRVYNRALSASEVLQLYMLNAPSTPYAPSSPPAGNPAA
jgi:hypothetical protein